MTEITRVPLLPVAKGSVTKIWLGIAAGVALAGTVAWAAMPKWVEVTVIKAGEGSHPLSSDVAVVNYTGMLKDGTVFDKGQQAGLPLSGSIPGFAEALKQTQAGGKYKFEIPARLAYGKRANGPIPANSDLTFDIEVLGFVSAEEYARYQQYQQMMQMQQMQQMQQGGKGGAPGGQPQMPQRGRVRPQQEPAQ